MAFVILSAGRLAHSKTRTLSFSSVVGVVLAGMVLVLAGGVVLGYSLSPGFHTAPPGEATVLETPAPLVAEVTPDNRLLIDRFGELSGRMIQLEAEAADLAFRIGIINEFESRLTPEERATEAKGPIARTPPGLPSGGPLLQQIEQEPPLLLPESLPDESGQLTDELSRMHDEIERLADMLAQLDRVVVSMNFAYMSFPGRQPVVGAALTSSFGNRKDPFTKLRAFHSGVDFPAPKGTPIFASAGGRVIYSGYRQYYGNTVEIHHGAGLVTRYAHASKLKVKVGQVVMPGEKIALVGSTGRSTGPHLHFEILKDGRFVDPTIYLARF